MSYIVRQLKQVGPPVAEPMRHRDPMGNAASAAGAVFEVEARELRLSADEVAERLSARMLHTTDLVLIEDRWMPIAEAPPFLDVAVPHARREQRLLYLKGAALVLGLLLIKATFLALNFWLNSLD